MTTFSSVNWPYLYIFTLNRCTACRFWVCPFISSEQRVYWLAERQSLKTCTKPITCGNFCAQRECMTCPNRRSDQGVIYSQSLYGMSFRGLSFYQQRTESILVVKKTVFKPVRKLSLVVTFVPSESARPDIYMCST